MKTKRLIDWHDRLCFELQNAEVAPGTNLYEWYTNQHTTTSGAPSNPKNLIKWAKKVWQSPRCDHMEPGGFESFFIMVYLETVRKFDLAKPIKFITKRLAKAKLSSEDLFTSYFKFVFRARIREVEEMQVARAYRDYQRRKRLRKRTVRYIREHDDYCGIVDEILGRLEPMVAEMVRLIILEGRPLADVAQQTGLRENYISKNYSKDKLFHLIRKAA